MSNNTANHANIDRKNLTDNVSYYNANMARVKTKGAKIVSRRNLTNSLLLALRKEGA